VTGKIQKLYLKERVEQGAKLISLELNSLKKSKGSREKGS